MKVKKLMYTNLKSKNREASSACSVGVHLHLVTAAYYCPAVTVIMVPPGSNRLVSMSFNIHFSMP